MEKELKAIVQAKGQAVFADADALMKELTQQGCSVTQVMTLGLILKGCPSVVNALEQPQLSEAEAKVLVSATVNQTGLSVGAVRRTLGIMMRAAEVKTLWSPKLLLWERRPQDNITTMVPNEEAALAALETALRQGGEVSSETIHDLDVLSENGSIRASYLLGEYFKRQDDEQKTQHGRKYFQRAAQQGYGPANGALADYMIRQSRKNMVTAAACFEDPTSITGHHGRRWKILAEQLLTYREDNKKRTRAMIGLQLVFLLLTLALLIPGFLQADFFGVTAIVVQLLSLGYLLYGSAFKPYLSCKVPCYALLISWLTLAFTLL